MLRFQGLGFGVWGLGFSLAWPSLDYPNLA
jgi:hypothetical protein